MGTELLKPIPELSKLDLLDGTAFNKIKVKCLSCGSNDLIHRFGTDHTVEMECKRCGRRLVIGTRGRIE